MNICRLIDKRPDYFQGGGGNVSVKLDGRIMAVKASGFKVLDISRDKGLVNVDYQTIRNFFNKIDHRQPDIYNNQSSKIISSSVINKSGQEGLRPSIETGFHALLGTYVVHSHSVYANLISCSKQPERLINDIFLNSGKYFIIANYTPPGFYLTLEVSRKLDSLNKGGHVSSQIILLKNHGLIVSADSAEATIKIHEKINQAIRSYFHLDRPYPEINIKSLGRDRYVSGTKYLFDYFKQHKNYFYNLRKYMLFPDQIVFCEDAITGDINQNTTNKIVIDIDKEIIFYNANFTEAIIMEEVLVSWAFVMDNLEKNNLAPDYISKEEADFVSNMEGEKYRKNLVK